ncbi:MAG TPA: molybdenum cofactor guanylyltransferase [Planctomycetota bacterium]|nr:molybdenum cofactor guanylyltransferase [Planctomycetota bacterium]
MSVTSAPAEPQQRGLGPGRSVPVPAPPCLSDSQSSDMGSATTDELSRWAATTTGVVFCGGKSSRMGVDKALLTDEQGHTMLERARRALAPLSREVWLACGPSARYADLGLPLVLDQRPDGGPLAGLETVLDRATTAWVAVLACDMPRVSSDSLRRLLHKAEAESLDACWMETTSGTEPLCAVYARTCLVPVRAALDAGRRRMIAFHAYPVGGRALRLAGLDVSEPHLAQNLNTPADWDEFRKGTR